MGDPLSVAAAALSLPGIFMSCVQCFELIQAGRNFEKDLLILSTKFSNQQLRFAKWGEACGFGTRAGYDRRLDEAQLRSHIERTLGCVKLLLDSGVEVVEPYNMDSYARIEYRKTRWSWTALKARMRKSRKESGITDATKWALADKKKLDDVIKHLSDLIADLERFTTNLGIPQRQKILVQYEIETISDSTTLEMIEASRMGPNDIVSDSASVCLQSLASKQKARKGDMDALSHSDTYATPGTFLTAREDAESHIGSTGAGEETEQHTELSPISESMHSQGRRIMEELLARRPSSGEYHQIDLGRSLYGKKLADCLDLDDFDAVAGANTSSAEDSQDFSLGRKMMREMKSFKAEFGSMMNLHPIGSSLRHFLASIEGPPASPYEGGIYHLLISVPNRYPISPPRCRFLTRIYHPNIDSRGEVCIEILDLESVLWSPAISISRLLLSIISILDDPGVEDPLVPEIAEVYIQDRQQYDQNARAYTQRYAQEVNPSRELTNRCLEMCTEDAEAFRKGDIIRSNDPWAMLLAGRPNSHA